MIAKKISSDLVIGNALISTKKKEITRTQIYKYYYIVDMLLPYNYYTYLCKNSFENFCDDYCFLVKRINNTIVVDGDVEKLTRYFRLGIPTEIASIFDIAGLKLNEWETQQISPINYEQVNIDDEKKHIKKYKS